MTTQNVNFIESESREVSIQTKQINRDFRIKYQADWFEKKPHARFLWLINISQHHNVSEGSETFTRSFIPAVEYYVSLLKASLNKARL